MTAQKLHHDLLVSQQLQQQGGPAVRVDPVMGVFAPPPQQGGIMMAPPPAAAGADWSSAFQAQQQHAMAMAFASAGPAGLAEQQQQQPTFHHPAAAANMMAMPGMTMSIPRSQFQSTLNLSTQQPIATTTAATTTADTAWVNALTDQVWCQTYDDVQQYVMPGEEVQTVEQKTVNSAFYGFMDDIRDKRLLVDEVNGVVVQGPGPDPDVEGDTEHLKQWAAQEGLEMPESVFQVPPPATTTTVGGLPQQTATGPVPLHEDPDMDALYSDEVNADAWADHFSKLQEQYQKNMNSTDYPFEENNPYRFAENPLQEGKTMLDLSNLAEAALAFEAVCQANPEHKEAWMLLGRTQASNEKDSLAIIALNNARRVDPTDIDVHAALAVSHTNEQNTGPAMDAMKMWLSHHPSYHQLSKMGAIEPDADVDVYEAYSPVDPTQLREAVTLYGAALEMNPTDPELHSNLGVIYNLSHQFDNAALSFQEAANLKPTDASLWNRLGASLANGGKGKAALDAYRRALDIHPGYVRAMYNMAVAQSNLGQHQAAARTIVRALSTQKGTTDPTRKNSNESHNLWDLLRMCLNMLHMQELVEKTYDEDLDHFAHMFE